MIKARFHANEEDYRPVTWPVPHPYWCTGYGEGHSVMVAYADSIDQILSLWPEANHINVFQEDVSEYQFTDRFPRPEWFNEK